MRSRPLPRHAARAVLATTLVVAAAGCGSSGTTLGASVSSARPLPLPPAGIKNYLHAMRTALARHLGSPLDRIKVVRVETRNVTPTNGDALVVYDLPARVVGNDNWVNYAVHDGRWTVADCHAPIGGESESKSPTEISP